MRTHRMFALLLQYLRPTERHLCVIEYITPQKFDWFREQAEKLGFRYVASVSCSWCDLQLMF